MGSMQSGRMAVVAAFAVGVWAAEAHFQVLMPSTDIVTAEGDRTVSLSVVFTHPMEQGPAMEMGKPVRFGVLAGGARKDLTATLREHRTDGKTSFESSYTMRSPGDKVFYLEPAPYWEAAERKMIVHYTKVVVNAFGEEEGWDRLVGFPVEIEPLVRPYGLWTGNAFRGVVRHKGSPVPFAEVEVEYWNAGKAVRIPSDPFITQVIKADGQGVFTYVMPRAGWWGFAALVDGDATMPNPDAEQVEIELGGLMWVRCEDMD